MLTEMQKDIDSIDESIDRSALYEKFRIGSILNFMQANTVLARVVRPRYY